MYNSTAATRHTHYTGTKWGKPSVDRYTERRSRSRAQEHSNHEPEGRRGGGGAYARARNSRVQSTRFLSCSKVMKMSIVVGCSRIHAGTQPLNMNIAPSLRIDRRMTSSVDCAGVSSRAKMT